MRMESPLNQLAQSIIYCMIGYLIFSVEVSEKLIIGPSQARQTWVHFMGATRRKVFTDKYVLNALLGRIHFYNARTLVALPLSRKIELWFPTYC